MNRHHSIKTVCPGAMLVARCGELQKAVTEALGR